MAFDSEARCRDQRGASELLGGILMTAVVVLTMSVAGMAVTTGITDQSGETPLVDCETSYEGGALMVTHAGGQGADASELAVVLQEGTDPSTRLPFVVDEGDGDGRFEVDESARLGPLADRTEVLVVTDGVIVCEAVVYPTMPTATVTLTTGPTPTATSTPTPTQTPAATVTPTPTPTATVSPGCPGNACDTSGQGEGKNR